jgi:hypothetical protein
MSLVDESFKRMSCADMVEAAIFEDGNTWLPEDELDNEVVEDFGLNPKLYSESERLSLNDKNNA